MRSTQPSSPQSVCCCSLLLFVIRILLVPISKDLHALFFVLHILSRPLSVYDSLARLYDTGIDFKIRTIELDDKKIKLQIWLVEISFSVVVPWGCRSPFPFYGSF